MSRSLRVCQGWEHAAGVGAALGTRAGWLLITPQHSWLCATRYAPKQGCWAGAMDAWVPYPTGCLRAYLPAPLPAANTLSPPPLLLPPYLPACGPLDRTPLPLPACLPAADLMRSPEMFCRAFNAEMNTQPETFTWNIMVSTKPTLCMVVPHFGSAAPQLTRFARRICVQGMMNNCVYRVKIHPQPLPSGGFGLRFEHPTVAGPTVGGWMNRGEAAEAKEQAKVGGIAL